MNTLVFEQEKKKIENLSSDNSLFINEFLVSSKSMPKASSMMVGYLQDKKQRIDIPQEKVLEHVVIVGVSGYGQKINFIYPNLIDIDNSFVVVTTDFLAFRALHNNQKTLIYDPSNPLTEAFNWIPLCKETDWAYSLAEATLINRAEELDSFHNQQIINFLAAIYCHTASLENPTPRQTYNLISKSSLIQIIDILFHSTSILAKEIAESLVLQALNPEVLEEYWKHIRTSLEWLKDPKIISFTDSDIAPDFSCLREQKIGVYLAVKENFYQLALHRLILTVLIKQSRSVVGMPIYIFTGLEANIDYMSCFKDLSALTKDKIALITLVNRIERWEWAYGREATTRMLADCYCKITLDTNALYSSKNFIKKANELIEYSSDGNSYRFNSDFDRRFSRSHLLFLGDNSAIVANTVKGSYIISQLRNKPYKSDINLLAKLLCLLIVVLSTIYLACYILFRVY
jgi:hypothetical protein